MTIREVRAAIRAFMPGFIATNPFRGFGAHSVGIGQRNNKKGGKTCLRFYVACKVPLDELPPSRRVPRELRIAMPGTGGMIDIPTDVIEAPVPQLIMQDPESEIRPVPGGVSGSVPNFGLNGTLGAWVFDKTDETVVMLSNAHVLGQSIGAEIIQPGSTDGGTPGTSRIGSVKRTTPFIPMSDNPTPDDCNFVDAAIGMADDPDLIDLTVLEIGPAIYAIDTVAEEDAVEKSGQTTGFTAGTVIDTDYNTYFEVGLGGGNFITAVFCDLIVIENTGGAPAGFANDGDSGSVLFGSDSDSVIKPAVGLVFAKSGPSGVACKIQTVFDELNLGVLCSSGYPAYLDGIAEGAEPDPHVASTRFTEAERTTRAAGRRAAGLARDVQRRLRASKMGRAVVDFVDTHRHEILMMLIRNSDVRRATTAALEPVLRGALTTKEVLDYTFREADVKRINRVSECLAADGSNALQKDFKRLKLTGRKIKGKTVAEVLNLQNSK